jgi:hypothetical protein
MPNNEFTENTSSTKKIVRYFNTLYELRLIVIDGPIKIILKKTNFFGEGMNPMPNVQVSGPSKIIKMKTLQEPCPLKTSGKEKLKWKES